MTQEELERMAEEEAPLWQGLVDQIRTLQTGVQNLATRRSEIVSELEARRMDVKQQLSEAHGRLSALVERTNELIEQLATVRENLASQADELDAVAADGRSRAAESAAIAEETLSQRVVEMAEQVMETTKETFDDTRQLMEKEFTEALQTKLDEALDTVEQTYKNAINSVEEGIQDGIDGARANVDGMLASIDSLAQQWAKSVVELKDSYLDVFERVDGLGRDVAALTDALDSALETTGAGMSAATSSLDDIRAIMGSVA